MAKSKKQGGGSSVVAVPELLSLENLVFTLVTHLGEDPNREGLRDTPGRFAQALRFLTEGYRKSVEQVLNRALYEISYDEMVIVKDIEVFSLREHHLLPFFGKAHVAYIANRKVIGLSKIPRLVTSSPGGSRSRSGSLCRSRRRSRRRFSHSGWAW